jgi:DNA repair exonuclease SbcCD ATPase subunit
MAEPQALEARIEEMERALRSTSAALDALAEVPDLRQELARAERGLEEALARIEALEAEIDSRAADLAEARQRAEEATAAAGAAEARYAPEEVDRLRDAVETLTASNAELREGRDGADVIDGAARAEIEGLRAARAMDLREMKLLLAELEPILAQPERADA